MVLVKHSFFRFSCHIHFTLLRGSVCFETSDDLSFFHWRNFCEAFTKDTFKLPCHSTVITYVWLHQIQQCIMKTFRVHYLLLLTSSMFIFGVPRFIGKRFPFSFLQYSFDICSYNLRCHVSVLVSIWHGTSFLSISNNCVAVVSVNVLHLFYSNVPTAEK